MMEQLLRPPHAGFMHGNKVALNPGREAVKGGDCGVFVATSQAALDAALDRPFSASLHTATDLHNLDATPPAVRMHKGFAKIALPKPSHRHADLPASWCMAFIIFMDSTFALQCNFQLSCHLLFLAAL